MYEGTLVHLYRTPEWFLASMVQAAHAFDLRVFKKVGEPPRRPRAPLRLLQFLPRSLFDQENARNGGGVDGAGLGAGGTSGGCMTLTQDPKAWEEGFKAGEAGKPRRCPNPAGSREAWSWWSGWVEDDATRQGLWRGTTAPASRP
jgi:hypothetical protein